MHKYFQNKETYVHKFFIEIQLFVHEIFILKVRFEILLLNDKQIGDLSK